MKSFSSLKFTYSFVLYYRAKTNCSILIETCEGSYAQFDLSMLIIKMIRCTDLVNSVAFTSLQSSLWHILPTLFILHVKQIMYLNKACVYRGLQSTTLLVRLYKKVLKKPEQTRVSRVTGMNQFLLTTTIKKSNSSFRPSSSNIFLYLLLLQLLIKYIREPTSGL